MQFLKLKPLIQIQEEPWDSGNLEMLSFQLAVQIRVSVCLFWFYSCVLCFLTFLTLMGWRLDCKESVTCF